MVVLFMAACSRKKNTFLSRTKHSVTSEFNILYNGNIAFETGKEQLAASYRDNFWETLPVERIELEESNVLPGESKDENFNRAEEKAAKTIQKHAIYLKGKEYNPQIDEAYILLGKARYFDGRFVQALDAFNFILKTYPTCNNINQAKIWKAKTHIRLNNEEGAIENLLKMNKNKQINKEDLADASAILSQALINLDSIEEALPYIKYASENVKDFELKGRYTYITGQLYDQLEKIDSANLEFDKVIALNRKSPRVYMINAYIEKARNFDFTKEDRVAFLELLFDLEEDRENRPFLDKIYNQIGEYYRKNDSIDLAVEYYNKSIQAYKEDRVMQSVNYQTLAEIYFDDRYYKFAGAYYDSTLTNLDEGTRQWRRITKKRENLDDVIKYEDIAFENDSTLQLVNMTEAQQLSYFSIYTTQLKQQAVEDSLVRIENEENISNNEFFNSNEENANEKKGTNTGAGSFYFYSSTTIAFGKQEFKKRWGNRRLEDNWRLSDKISKLETIEEEVAAPIAENDLYKPETYIALIPKDEKVIDSIKGDRDFAYYQLGLIYKEKFKEYDLASERLEALLSFNPEQRLVLPTLYNLHKINEVIGNETLAAQYKNEIITRYPDSRYAEVLLNPNAILATDESSPEYKYGELYKDFEASKYQKVIEMSETYISIYFGNIIIPKFELLKANAIGRQQGYEPYKKALNFVSLNYPNSEEGKEAIDLYNNLLPKIANKVFLSDGESERWKVAYSFNTEDREAAEELQGKLNKAIEGNSYDEMSTSIDYYLPETIFVMIHGLNSRKGAKGFADILSERKKDKIKNSHFEISSENYAIIQIHKNLEDYLAIDFSKTLSPEEEKEKARLLKVEQDKVRDQRIIEEKARIRGGNKSKSGKIKKDSK
jgi:tetratricopeptide (TPR) repeat protein